MPDRETDQNRSVSAVTVVILAVVVLAGAGAFLLAGRGEDGPPPSATDTATASFTPLDSSERQRSSDQGRSRSVPDTDTSTRTRIEDASAVDPSSTVRNKPVSVEDTVRGEVRRVGSTPFSRTIVEGDETVTVEGKYQSELARLSGALVAVFGPVETGQFPGPTMNVTKYVVLSVGGERPEAGTLRRDSVGFYLIGAGDTVRLRHVPPSFPEHLGAKLWIIASKAGTVQRYGVLKPVGMEEDQ